MCSAEGMFGLQSVMQIGGAMVGSSSDASNYNRQMRAINNEADAINKSTIFKYQQQSLQEQEIQDKTNIDIANMRSSEAAATGTATAAAATGGVEGNSVAALNNTFRVATGHDISIANLSNDNQVGELEQEKHGTTLDAANRLQSLRDARPEDPSNKMIGRYLGAALGVGQSFLANTTKDPSAFLGRRFG